MVVVGGGAVGVETATFLAEKGNDVTVLEMLDRCGADMGFRPAGPCCRTPPTSA